MTDADTTLSDRDEPSTDADTVQAMSEATPASTPAGGPSRNIGDVTQVGRYRIIDRLGAGGMGIVYRALDPQLDREVALKLLQTARAGEQESIARMLREAKAAAKIRHPNVVTVYDAGEVDGRAFIAMELMSGIDLAKWFAERHPWSEVLRVMLWAAQGLRAAHEVGLVHRDFKPDNVILERDGTVKVLDFGLARAAYDRETQARVADQLAEQLARTGIQPGSPSVTEIVHLETLTRTGALIGTPAYMAPEQYRRKPLDARTDQFSFCVALFMGLYGRRPFGGTNFAALTMNVVNGRIEDPEDPSVAPLPLLEILHKGLATDPEDRYPSMDALISELQTILDRHAGGEIGSKRAPRRALVIGLAVLATTVTVAIAQEYVPRREPATEAPTPDPVAAPNHGLALELAAGQGRNELESGPQVWISPDAIRVVPADHASHRDIELHAGRFAAVKPGEYPIAQLVEAIEWVRPMPAAVEPLVLHVDRRTPFATIVHTVASAEAAGFLRYDFALRTNGEIRVLEFTPRGQLGGQSRRAALELAIHDDRVQVGARALDGEPTLWPLDTGTGTCEQRLGSSSAGLQGLGRIGAQLCALDSSSIPVIVTAAEDVGWERIVMVLGAALPSADCLLGVVIEPTITELANCATPVTIAELAAAFEPAGEAVQDPEPGVKDFRQWCFINTRLKSKKVCRPTQSACIEEAKHWVENPRRSCRGER